MSDQNVKAAQKYLNAMFGGHKGVLCFAKDMLLEELLEFIIHQE